MPTIVAHPAVLLVLGPAFARARIEPKLWWLGGACAVLPDFDGIGYFLGVPYEAAWGHRGMTHSLAFAAFVGLALAPLCRRWSPRASLPAIAAFLFLCTASHGLLDMLTDGGLGVALFAPFHSERWFFPWRPIAVSPLGLSQFLSGRGLAVLWSEARWVWLPAVVAGGLLWYAGRRRPPEPSP
jgi:inner membrane protein